MLPQVAIKGVWAQFVYSGSSYYFNIRTEQTLWETPDEFEDEKEQTSDKCHNLSEKGRSSIAQPESIYRGGLLACLKKSEYIFADRKVGVVWFCCCFCVDD